MTSPPVLLSGGPGRPSPVANHRNPAMCGTVSVFVGICFHGGAVLCSTNGSPLGGARVIDLGGVGAIGHAVPGGAGVIWPFLRLPLTLRMRSRSSLGEDLLRPFLTLTLSTFLLMVGPPLVSPIPWMIL